MRDESLLNAQMERPSMPRTCAKLHSLSKYLGTILTGRMPFRKVMPRPPICLLLVADDAAESEAEVRASFVWTEEMDCLLNDSAVSPA